MKVRVGDIVLSFSWKSLLLYQWKLCELSLRYCGLQLRKWHLRVVDWNFSGSTRTCQHRLHKSQNIYGHTSLYFTSWPLFFSFLHITNTWKQTTVYNTKIKYLIVFCSKKIKWNYFLQYTSRYQGGTYIRRWMCVYLLKK